MRRYLIALLGAALTMSGLVGFTAVTTAPAHASGVSVIYFSAHEDDEIATLGPGMAADFAAGNNVHVVFATDGTATSARHLMCNTTGEVGHNPTYHPASYAGNPSVCSESYIWSGGTTQASAANMKTWRHNEAIAAVNALRDAADPSHTSTVTIDFADYPDGSLTAAQADSIMTTYTAMYPNSSLNAQSWFDHHNDHYRMGAALNHYCDISPGWGRCTFWRFYRYNPTYLGTSGTVTYPTTAMTAASNEYGLVNTSIGRYGIGWNWSAWPVFEQLRDHHLSGQWHYSYNHFTTTQKNYMVNTWMPKCGPTSVYPGAVPPNYSAPYCYNNGWA